MDTESIKSLLNQLEKEISDIKANALKLSWYMRGGVSYADIMNMSVTERKLISEIITENIEITKKSGMPLI